MSLSTSANFGMCKCGTRGTVKLTSPSIFHGGNTKHQIFHIQSTESPENHSLRSDWNHETSRFEITCLK